MTELSTAISATIANVLLTSQKIAELKQQAIDMRRASVEPLLEMLAKSGLVSHIIVRGYTPGFNDGEPCEHSYDFWVNIDQIASEEYLEYVTDLAEEINEGLQDSKTYDRTAHSWVDVPDAKAANIKLCAEHGAIFEKPPAEYMQAISEILVEAVNEERDTDYLTVFTFKDGAWSRDDRDYDCGY